jgi:hypothetical protein
MANDQERLRISEERLAEINRLLLNPQNRAIRAFLDVIAKYGTVEEINRKAEEARQLPNLLDRLEAVSSPYLSDLRWLIAERDRGAFISMPAYRRGLLGERESQIEPDPRLAVTLEISACQYFPWLITEARQAIERGELMPGRVIRVRKMKESEADQGDLLAMAAAMQIIGASYVETLDTKGSDGANIHLGGPETICGYFGGIGQPNDYALNWLDEYLYYYTNYGIHQALNVNPGTIFLGYLLYKLGINNAFKISVFCGNDNPYSVLWTLMTARLLARADGTTPLIGFNFSNSVNNETIELCAEIRGEFGFEEVVRFEHHITETWKHILRQPYLRRAELVEVARRVPNISAKHEGGDPETEQMRAHPSDVLDYFLSKTEIEAQGLMPALLQNYLDKHESLNRTAEALTRCGIAIIAARNLHRYQGG